MAVKIEMEMPCNCWDCKIAVASNGSCFCPLIGAVVIDNPRMRDSECPLQEVKECK